MFKTSMVVAALSVSGLVGLACSSSRVAGNASDGALTSGGQAGSTGEVCIVCSAPGGATAGQCDASPSCNPGDMPITSDEDCGFTAICYTNVVCGQSFLCRAATSARICGGTRTDAGILEPQDASADPDDGGTTPCCGDGSINADNWERCDLGNLNGMCLDAQWNPVGYPEDMSCQSRSVLCNCPAGTSVLCSTMCTISFIDGP